MTATFFSGKTVIQYFLPVTLTLFMLVTIERRVQTDIGGYERLYGFPFAFISSNYAFTGHYDVYVLMMCSDLFVYFMATLLFFKLLHRLGIKLKTHWTLTSIGIMIAIVWICLFSMITFDSTFKLLNDFDSKTTSRQLYFGTYPK
jgi:hypothetical protein